MKLLILILLSSPVFADSPGDEQVTEENPVTKEQADQQNQEGIALDRAYRELYERELIPTEEDVMSVQAESIQSAPLFAVPCVSDTELWDDDEFEARHQEVCTSRPGGGVMLPKLKPVSGN